MSPILWLRFLSLWRAALVWGTSSNRCVRWAMAYKGARAELLFEIAKPYVESTKIFLYGMLWEQISNTLVIGAGAPYRIRNP